MMVAQFRDEDWQAQASKYQERFKIFRTPFAASQLNTDPPPLKWSDLRYVFDIQEDCNGKEAIQA